MPLTNKLPLLRIDTHIDNDSLPPSLTPQAPTSRENVVKTRTIIETLINKNKQQSMKKQDNNLKK